MFVECESTIQYLMNLAREMKVKVPELNEQLDTLTNLDLTEMYDGGNTEFLLSVEPQFADRAVNICSRRTSITLIPAFQFSNETQH